MAKWDEEFDKILAETLSKKSNTSKSKQYQANPNRQINLADGYIHVKAAANNKTVAPAPSVSSRVTDRMTTSRGQVAAKRLASSKKEKEGKKKWYEDGYFEDGYDFGDVTKTILGLNEDTATIKDLTWNSLKRGYLNSRYGEETYKAMYGKKNQKEDYEKLLESDEYQFTPGNDLASGVSGAFEQVGQMFRQYTHPRTLAAVTAAAGGAVALGNAGPQALVPEEIISVPAAAIAGFSAGSAASSLEIEAGHAYNEMIELGVKEDIARKIATAVGVGNASLEAFQVDELADAYKATAGKGATKTFAKILVDELKERGVDVLKETAQEDVQELITIGGVQAAHKLDKGELAYSAEEVGKRLLDTTKSSLLSFGMMNVPAVAKNTFSTIRDQKLANAKNDKVVEAPFAEKVPVVGEKPVVENAPGVEQTQAEVKPKRVLYTGSPNTDIKQFKVGGGERQTGDRYGRGVYLTTNENTAKAYAGENGRVYQTNVDDLNIFNLNDTVTPEMRDSLIRVFNEGDTQFRNSMLRNFRTEQTFDDFESAEAFFDHQRKVWKEQDGEYSANKPEIKEADYKTGKAVIEFTDFENWENNIGTLTGNHLYDALKSLSTDDFSSFITGHGFDGISFDEDADNQQFVIYRNEDRIRIDEDAAENATTTPVESENASWRDAAQTLREPEFDGEEWTREYIDHNNSVRSSVLDSAAREVIRDVESGMSSEQLAQKSQDALNEYEQLQAKKDVSSYTEAEQLTLTALYNQYTLYNSVAKNPSYVNELKKSLDSTSVSEDVAPVNSTQQQKTQSEYQELIEERRVLKDTLESLTAVSDFGDSFKELSKRYDEVNEKILAFENPMTGGNGSTGEIDSTVEAANPDEAKAIVMKMANADVGDINESTVFKADGFTVQRRMSNDEKHWTYTVTSPDGTFRRGMTDVDGIDFWDDVQNSISHLIDGTEVERSIPAKAPVRVVSTDKGDHFESDKNGFNERNEETKRARILTDMPPRQNSGKQTKKTDSLNVDKETKNGVKSPLKLFEEYIADNGFVFEKLSKKTKNRELEAKWDGLRRVRSAAQYLIGNGADGVKSLKSLMETVEKAGLTQDFYNYLGHYRNIDGMTLDTRFNTYNRGVWGDVSAAESQFEVDRLERLHPEFKGWAEDVYAYNNHLRDMMVKGGLISQKTANLLAEMYPHYVPIHRVGFDESIDYEDTNHVGVNSPLKSATGGNQDIEPLFNTMAERTMAVYKAVAMNNFGLELYNTLYPGRLNSNNALAPMPSNAGARFDDIDVDYSIDGFDPREELLQSGKPGSLPTFSVFMDGERHTFDINSEMYTAMKPTSDFLSMKIPVLSDISNLRRNLITAYSPWFTLKNAVKDIQEVVINSQHPLATYASVPRAIAEIASKGKLYQEYVANGGEQNTYFDTEDSSFNPNKGVLDYLENKTGLKHILKANNIVEMIPRLAEYIASREAGRSVEVSMLDAARVTTNFGAGGKLTKALDRNGATFLNASVQGFVQQARNIYEAKQNGLKGWAGLAARYAVAGLPAVLLNNLIWEDDEEYQQLPDYITNNYYIVGKYGDGQFVRIPKGRTAAVIQNAIKQVSKMSSGDDEADWNEFYKIFMENIAPNNPVDDNIFAPIRQVKNNKTWYDEDLVPYRLKDLPESEQFDEKTDSISIWLGEKLDYSPKKINYLLDQYSGVLGDTILPYLTPKAESPIDSPIGKLVAPLRDIFTTDSVLNNRVTGDFYETLEAAEAKAESDDATPEDKLVSSYLIYHNAEISKLMQQQRNIQTSDLPDSEKYKQNRELKEQINEMQKKALEGLENVSLNGIYGEVGDKRFNFGYDSENKEDRWFEIKPKKADGDDNWYYQQEQAVTHDLGISYKEYWNNKQMYDDFYYVASGFDKESSSDDMIETARSVFGYERFAEYAGVLKTLKADKDANGESIEGTRFPKVQEYVNSLDIPDIEKKILMKMQYPNYKKHNYAIVEYLDKREDISYQEWIDILGELGYMVDSENYVTW